MKLIATLLISACCFYSATASAERLPPNAEFECINGVTGQKIPGTFDRRERLLIELGGGECRVIPLDLNNGFDGDISQALDAAIGEKVIRESIYRSRKKFDLDTFAFLYLTDVRSSGFKYKKYTLVFEDWQGQRCEVAVKVNFWKDKLKSLKLMDESPY